MDNQYTYTDAFEELQAIVSEIEQGEISVDELSEKVRRATLLINVCKAKLTATETEVNDILASLSDESDTPADGSG
ncbi:exodeoxyribonuclease VII small subunit [Parapedobacter soli]|uniref:exodeoxyribonuclease VII small subunit n=1 Tax=Parapedobacter soli TaxID=416955 RepID=UPI0021C6117A|nr:exodeoxyribonuclease VII small subunit [Parapedobacter soli]